MVIKVERLIRLFGLSHIFIAVKVAGCADLEFVKLRCYVHDSIASQCGDANAGTNIAIASSGTVIADLRGGAGDDTLISDFRIDVGADAVDGVNFTSSLGAGMYVAWAVPAVPTTTVNA